MKQKRTNLNSMKAIVLTYDPLHPVTDHMIFKYNQLWPNHPFVFQIPYQSRKTFASPHAKSANREYIKCPRPITQTVLKLLEDIEPEEWVYWCMDDWYPIKINVRRMEYIVNWLQNDDPPHIDWISVFARFGPGVREYDKLVCREKQIQDPAGETYFQIVASGDFWRDQFMRAKTLRDMFLKTRDFADPQDGRLFHENIPLPDWVQGRRFLSSENLVLFYESTMRGATGPFGLINSTCMTDDFYRSVVKHGLKLPTIPRLSNLDADNRPRIYKQIRRTRVAYLMIKHKIRSFFSKFAGE